ncbi:MAG: LamG domain-containing protein, partial [Planctomycetota bacterium]
MKRFVAVLACLILPLIAAAPASAALVAQWEFEEASGTTTAFDSVGALDGTLVGTGDFTPGAGYDGNGALWLEGTDGYVEVLDSPLLEFAADQPFSISLWYKRDGVENDQGLITKGYHDTSRADTGYYQLQTRAGGFCFDSRQGAGGNPRTRIDNTAVSHGDNQWHNFVVVRDSVGDEIRTYVDQLEVVVYDMGAGPPNNGDWAMGANDDSLIIGNHYNRYTQGFFDDARIYDHALTESEVLALGGIALLTWDKATAMEGDW